MFFSATTVSSLRPRVVQHVYQKSVSGEIIFYSSRDAVVFFTIYCVCARKYGIRSMGLCIMPDHTHQLIQARDRSVVTPFVRECYHLFAMEFNRDSGRSGQLFKHEFGCAAKVGDKQIRSVNAYVANNPVEKKMCLRAEEYRWNFLAYAVSQHPFSEKIVLKKASAPMRRAIEVIKDCRRRNVPVNYATYDRITEGLQEKELRQLVDYIITSYDVVDHEAMLSSYKSYDGMLEAFANTKGAEYDINEDFDPYSNRNYSRIADYLKQDCGIAKAKDAIRLPVTVRIQLARRLIRRGIAPEYQVRKYLHLCSGGGQVIDL